MAAFPILPDQSDEELARLIQREEDEQAFAALMQRYEARLLRYGRRFISEKDAVGDVVQDVFVAVWENIRSFDAAQRFSPWIYRIAHNALVDALRRKAKEPIPIFDFDRIMPHPVYEDPATKEKEREEIRVLVKSGIDALAPAYREIIDLYYFEYFSYREISDILHVPLGTVGIRLSRAREALKKRISPAITQNYE